MKLAQFIAERRMTHKDFADLVGTTQASVSRWTSGARRPRGEQMRRIAEATGGAVTANDFMAPEEPGSGGAGRAPPALAAGGVR